MVCTTCVCVAYVLGIGPGNGPYTVGRWWRGFAETAKTTCSQSSGVNCREWIVDPLHALKFERASTVIRVFGQSELIELEMNTCPESGHWTRPLKNSYLNLSSRRYKKMAVPAMLEWNENPGTKNIMVPCSLQVLLFYRRWQRFQQLYQDIIQAAFPRRRSGGKHNTFARTEITLDDTKTWSDKVKFRLSHCEALSLKNIIVVWPYWT